MIPMIKQAARGPPVRSLNRGRIHATEEGGDCVKLQVHYKSRNCNL